MLTINKKDIQKALALAKEIRTGKNGHKRHIDFLRKNRNIYPVLKELMPQEPRKGDIWFLERRGNKYNPPMVLLVEEKREDEFRVCQVHIDPILSRRNKDLIVPDRFPRLFNSFGEFMIEVWNSFDVKKSQIFAYCGNVDELVLDAVKEASQNLSAKPPLWSPLPPRHASQEALEFAELETKVASAYAYIPGLETAKEASWFAKMISALRKKVEDISLPFSSEAFHILPFLPEPVAAASNLEEEVPVGFIHFLGEDNFEITTLSARLHNRKEDKDKDGILINIGGTVDLGDKKKLFEKKGVDWIFSVALVVEKEKAPQYYAAKVMNFDPDLGMFHATILVPSREEADRGKLSMKLLASSWN